MAKISVIEGKEGKRKNNGKGKNRSENGKRKNISKERERGKDERK